MMEKEDVESQEQKDGGVGQVASSRKILPSQENEIDDVRTKKEKNLW